MTFIAKPYSFFFRSDLMRYRNIIIYFSMALYTSHIGKMRSLVRQPFMLLNDINFSPVAQKLKPTEVRVAIKANGVIICYRFLKVSIVSDTYLISMRIVALPACESVIPHFKVSTLFIFSFYLFKMIFRKLRVTSMTINTIILLFHSEFSRMRKLCIFFGMTVGTAKASVI